MLRPSVPWVDSGGRPTREFFDHFRRLTGDSNLSDDAIARVVKDLSGIAQALGSTDGSVANIPPQSSQAQALVIGLRSVQHVGSLADGLVSLSLEGDEDAPGPSRYYGTSASGGRGFHALSDALVQGPGVTFTVGEDGRTTVSAEGGAAGIASTDDLPEGSSNLYYTDARVDARIAASGGGSGGGVCSPVNFPLVVSPASLGGAYYIGDDQATNLGTMSPSANLVYYFPFVPPRTITLATLGVNVTSAVAGKIRAGIYADAQSGGTNMPGALLASTGDLSGAATGPVTTAVGITLQGGRLYWAATLHQSGASVLAATSGAARAVMGRSSASLHGQVSHLTQSVAAGWTEMPAAAAPTARTLAARPLLYFTV